MKVDFTEQIEFKGQKKAICWDDSGSLIWESQLTDYSSVRRIAVEPGRYGTFPNEW